LPIWVTAHLEWAQPSFLRENGLALIVGDKAAEQAVFPSLEYLMRNFSISLAPSQYFHRCPDCCSPQLPGSWLPVAGSITSSRLPPVPVQVAFGARSRQHAEALA